MHLLHGRRELERWLADGGGRDSIDGITLVQEYIEAADPSIVRLEYVGGRLVYALRPPALDELGLIGALKQSSVRLTDRSLVFAFDAPDTLPDLPAAVEIAAYRIAQEAMVNVERHAEATSLTVTWISDGATGVLEITDDGRGFTLGESGRVDSYGLVGMRERAASIGASMEVESAPDAGTTIRCVVVSQPEEDALAA